MKKSFSEKADEQPKLAPYYDDACAQLLYEHGALIKSWPESRQEKTLSPSTLSWNAFVSFRLEDTPANYAGVESIGYQTFRQMFSENRLLFVQDAMRLQSISLLSVIQQGHRNICATPKLHSSIDKESMLSIATLCRLDGADYAYALYAALPCDDREPPKTITFRSPDNNTHQKGYLPLDSAFLEKYLEERKHAAGDIEAILHNARRGSWRVPNFPPKPGDIL